MSKKVGNVGIIYSENVHYSSESKNLAHYLCGLLSASGYAQIFMIPYSSEGPISDISPNKRVFYKHPRNDKLLEIPASDVSFSHWNVLPECHLVVVTVNPSDSNACGNKLAEILENYKKRIPVFSIQRGVRYGTSLSEGLESKGMTVIEAVVGFSVVIEPKQGAYVPTTRSPSIVFQRLSKEEVAIADTPLRLLETMDLDVYFRKFLSPHAWGLMAYEQLYVLNMLTKGSIVDTLSKREWRLIYALLLRETNAVLIASAKDNVWKPDMLLVTQWLTPKLVELILVLPQPFFTLLFWLFGLFPRKNIISPGQLDLMEGRKSIATLNLQELVLVADRNKVPCPLIKLVADALHHTESSFEAHIGSRQFVSYDNVDVLTPIVQALPAIYTSHHSVQELFYWVVRVAGVTALLGALIFLFIHDY
eukprot:gene75-82_t